LTIGTEVAEAQQRDRCGWAISAHRGSTFGRTMATLHIRTDVCVRNGLIKSKATSHSKNTSFEAYAAGWRVGDTYLQIDQPTGSAQWIGEAKVDWTLQLCGNMWFGWACLQVGSGSAWARHTWFGNFTVSKAAGGWPY
jgi:hypothetical protein